MKAFLGLLAFILFFVLISCDPATPVSPTQGTSKSAVSGAISSADVTNTMTPVTGAVFNACNRELIDYEGTIHRRVTRKTKADGSVSFEIVVNIKGAGTGRITKNSYQFIQHQDDTQFWEVGPPFPATRILERSVRLVSKGEQSNTYVIFTSELEFNESGSLIFREVKTTTTCQ